MKTNKEIREMLDTIESLVSSEERGPLVMALEWVLDMTPSTSVGLEEWLEDLRA